VAAEAIAGRAGGEGQVEEIRRLVRLERFKLWRRPLPKILLAIVGGITFTIPWLFFLALGGAGDEATRVDGDALVDRLAYPGVLDASYQYALSFGIPALVILTATSFGGEFAWGTVRLLLARGEGRGAFVLSKVLAVGQWWLLTVAVASGTAIVAGTVIAAIDGAPGPASVGLGTWTEFAGRLALAWAASLPYAAMTAFFVVLFRSTAFGLGLGLTTFFGEGIVLGTIGGLDLSVIDLLMRAGITYNLRSVMGTLDGRENALPVAVLILAMYGAAGILGAIRHLRRHDVVVAGVG
jgi:ABC-type transport system involved in multi-copper enzyme maturation permease subunit